MEDVPYGRILREGWLIILVAMIVGAGAAYGIAKLLPETYAATSTLLLQVESNQASLFERNQFSLARIKSYPVLVDNPEVVDGVRADLDISPEEYTDRDLRRMLSAENTSDTVLLVVRADAPTAVMAADMANSAARHLSLLIEATENAEGDERYVVTLDQVLPAVEPLSPIAPQTMAITGLGGITGLAVGAIIAVYRTTTNRHLSTIGDVRRASGLPVVGQIPKRRRRRRSRDGAATALSPFEDTISNIAALGGAARRFILLVPADPAAIDDEALRGLLAAYAEGGQRSCVLDARTMQPGEREEVPSTADVDMTASDPLDESPLPDRTVFPDRELFAAIDRGTSATLARALPDTCRILGGAYDMVIVVCDPAASSVIESAALADPAVVIGVQHNQTEWASLVSVVTRMGVMRVRPLGVLMTRASTRAIGVVAESWRESDRIADAEPAGETVTVGGDHGDDTA